MAIKIRLTRIGRHKEPIYRIVVADSRFPRDGRYIEQIGFYNPAKSYKEADLDVEKTVSWLKKGAQYSESIKALLTEKGAIAKAKEGKKVLSKKVNKTKKHDFSKKKAPSHPKKPVFHPQPKAKPAEGEAAPAEKKGE